MPRLCDSDAVTLHGGFFQPDVGVDVVDVVVMGRKFVMNRAVLINSSGFFRAMLMGAWKDSSDGRPIALHDVDVTTFTAIAEYITKGKCTLVDDGLLLPTLRASHLLQIPQLLDAAETAVRQRLCCENVIGAFQVSAAFDLHSLRAAAEALMLRNLPEVVALMIELPDDEVELLKASCEALASLCKHGTSAVWRRRERAIESGALDAVVALMHRDALRPLGPDVEMQRAGCLAAANIYAGSQSYERKLRADQAGALMFTLHAVLMLVNEARSRFPDDSSLQDAALRFLDTPGKAKGFGACGPSLVTLSLSSSCGLLLPMRPTTSV